MKTSQKKIPCGPLGTWAKSPFLGTFPLKSPTWACMHDPNEPKISTFGLRPCRTCHSYFCDHLAQKTCWKRKTPENLPPGWVFGCYLGLLQKPDKGGGKRGRPGRTLGSEGGHHAPPPPPLSRCRRCWSTGVLRFAPSSATTLCVGVLRFSPSSPGATCHCTAPAPPTCVGVLRLSPSYEAAAAAPMPGARVKSPAQESL